jgi:hypothetical protein
LSSLAAFPVGRVRSSLEIRAVLRHEHFHTREKSCTVSLVDAEPRFHNFLPLSQLLAGQMVL